MGISDMVSYVDSAENKDLRGHENSGNLYRLMIVDIFELVGIPEWPNRRKFLHQTLSLSASPFMAL